MLKFDNPKTRVASVVMEQVPCSFAKMRKGKLGTHFAAVFLDKNYNVLRMVSECELLHGEGIEAIHEMGGGATCYAPISHFRDGLRMLKQAPQKHVQGNQIDPLDKLSSGIELPNGDTWVPNILVACFKQMWQHAAFEHNQRLIHNQQLTTVAKPVFGLKAEALQRVVNNVVGNMIGLPQYIRRGAHYKKVENHSKEERFYKPVLDVEEHCFGYARPEVGVDTPGYRLVLQPHGNALIFAVRGLNGDWNLDQDKIKSWASSKHSSLSQAEQHKFDSQHKGKFCIFCKSAFERMSKHTEGAKHIERVLEVVKLACKATTPVGLRMLNNPKHKNVFLKRR